MGKGDRLMLNFYTDLWQDVDSSATVSPYCPGFDIYMMYALPFGKSKFSFDLGLGIGTHNLRSDAIPENELKFDVPSSEYVETGRTIFSRIPGSVNSNEIEYDINKLTLTYFDIPLELRYKAENKKGKAIKFAVGFKTGYLLNSHTKYKGDDPTGSGADIKNKTFRIRNIESLRYGVTLRFGYGMYNVFGFYSLTKLFETNKGPEMYPVSVGICITPF